MERGLATAVKRRYKINLVKNILLACEHSTPADFLAAYSVKDVIYSLSKIWWELDSDLVRAAWHRLKLNLSVSQVVEIVNSEELMSNFAKIGISVTDVKCNEWLTNDSSDPGYGFITDQEIVELMMRKSEAISDANDGDEDENGDDNADHETSIELNSAEGLAAGDVNVSTSKAQRIITADLALDYANELMKWLETQEGARSEDILFMQRIKEIAAGRCYQNLSTSIRFTNAIVTVAQPGAATANDSFTPVEQQPVVELYSSTTALMEVDCNGQCVVLSPLSKSDIQPTKITV
jgi:hypothetical protein